MDESPSTAKTHLMAAMQSADEYAHDSGSDPAVLAQIEDLAGAIKGYLMVVNPPSDIRIQSYADEMNNLIP